MNYWIDGWKNSFDFSGRATRTQYWMFGLLNLLATFALALFAALLGDSGVVLYALYALASLVPMLSIGIRRLHDTGRSGWWLLLAFIPLGGIVVFVFYCLESDGDNGWGPNPHTALSN